MRIRKEVSQDLYSSLVEMLADEIIGYHYDDATIVERLAEIIYEEYPQWSEKRCEEMARQFYDSNYNDAYVEAKESFEPTPREEAEADIRQETMAAIQAGRY